MNELDRIMRDLAKEGYYVQINRRANDCHCWLWSHKGKIAPQGTGNTALEAVLNAVDNKRALEESDKVPSLPGSY